MEDLEEVDTQAKDKNEQSLDDYRKSIFDQLWNQFETDKKEAKKGRFAKRDDYNQAQNELAPFDQGDGGGMTDLLDFDMMTSAPAEAPATQAAPAAASIVDLETDFFDGPQQTASNKTHGIINNLRLQLINNEQDNLQ